MKNLFRFIVLSIVFTMNVQDKLLYSKIPKPAKKINVGNTESRMMDGLVFGYYQVTEGLTEKDLTFTSNKRSRTTLETINHRLVLSEVILKDI